MREDLAQKLRDAYWGDAEDYPWHEADYRAKQKWLRVADAVMIIIGSSEAQEPSLQKQVNMLEEKNNELRQALWSILEEAQITLRVDP